MQGSKKLNRRGRRMNRRSISLLAAFAMVVTGTLTIAPIAYAAGDAADVSFEGDFPDSGDDPVLPNDATGQQVDSSQSIGVYAETTGGGALYYNIRITWGSMKFKYDHGGVWNPQTHTYSGTQKGSWLTKEGSTTYVGGANTYDANSSLKVCTAAVNNGISVVNNSNYPMNAEFSYSATGTTTGATGQATNPFNSSTTATSVIGIFDTNNTTLKSTVDNSSIVDTRSASAAVTNPTVKLAMDHTQLATGQTYYTVNGATNYYTDMYFSLYGKPDRSSSLTTSTQTGAITVKITPASGASEVTVP